MTAAADVDDLFFTCPWQIKEILSPSESRDDSKQDGNTKTSLTL